MSENAHRDLLAEAHAEFHALLSRMEEVRWKTDRSGSYIEIRFVERFDASFFIVGDQRRRGSDTDCAAMERLRFFAVSFFTREGEKIGAPMPIHQLQERYRRTRKGERVSGMDWIRFHAPSNAIALFLFDIAPDAHGELCAVGANFFRPA